MRRYNKRGDTNTSFLLLVLAVVVAYGLLAGRERAAMKGELDLMYGTLLRIEQQQQLDARVLSELRAGK